MATATSSGGTSLNLMACVRESSPQQEDLVSCDATDSEMARNAADPCSKKRRFHPFRGLRRMFRKKTSRHQQPQEMQEEEQPCATPVQNLDSHRSRSTSELLSGDEPCPRRRSGNGLFPCHSGLSVSHDSVFTAEHRTPHSSSEDLDTAQSSSSLSIQQLVLPGVRAELFDAVRRRRGRGDCTSEDDEDLGLPRSPCNSPTTADVLLEKGLKENATKSHSTCSDGSLLSMGSSEMDEDSLGQHSGHSSKLSLHEKKTYLDNDIEFDFEVSAAPALNHSAARHKISVKPKRTHGAPRRRRIQQLASGSPLPSTPEVNEETSGRSVSPELKTSTNDELSTAAEEGTVPHSIANLLPAETQLKSASLPPGLALPTSLPPAEMPAVMKLSRSRSNVAYRQTESAMHHYQRSISEQDVAPVTRLVHQYYSKTETEIISHALVTTETQKRVCGTLGEENEEMRQDEILVEDMYKEKDKDDKKKDESSFFRKFIRRSGKKKKEAPEPDSTPNTSSKVPVVPKRLDIKGRYIEPVSEYTPSQHHYVGRTGSARGTPAARQRVKPINIPASPDVQRRLETEKEIEEMTVGVPVPSSPTPPVSEPEPLKVNRMQVSYSASPPKPTWPEAAPAWKDNYGIDPDLGASEAHFKPRMRIAGLSSYQQRVSQLGSELREEREYSSLIDTTLSEEFSEVTRQNAVKKSKSFRREPEPSHGFLGDLDSTRGPWEKSSKSDPLWKYEDVNLALRQSEVIASHPTSGLDAQGRMFTKNSGSSSRNVIGMENSPVARVRTSKVPERFMKKSASLDSISSFGESKKTSSPEPKKSSSSESMSSYTQVTQTDGPIAEQEDTSVDVPKPSAVVFSIKPALPEPLKSSADSRLSTDRIILKPIHEHRVHVTRPRPMIPSPTTETVPEFLRVQLNRVDSKPATNVVLSTSAVFDSAGEEKSGRLRRKESINLQQEKPTSEEDVQNIRERKLSREDDKIVDSIPGKSEGVTLRTSISKQESDGSQKQRSKSLPGSNPVHVSNRKYSVVTVTPTSAAKPVLKKQSSSLESVEDRKAFIKKQISQDYEDITIIEKPSTSSVEPESIERKSLVKEEETTSTVLEGSSVEVILRSKKTVTSRDLCSKKDEDQSSVEKRFSSADSTSSQESKKFGLLWKDEDNTEKRTSGGDEVVVLRKKSVTRNDVGRGSSMGKDEEPELLKVFARRSLKLKDSDSEALGQQVGAKTRDSTSEQHGTKSRDSDKENEGGDSPREERKKQLIKEPLAESKLHIDPSDLPPVLKVSSPGITLNNASRNGSLGIGANKYQRCSTVTLNNENGLQNDAINVYRKENSNNSPDRRQRNKTVPESPKTTDSVVEKTPHRAWANIYKEKDIDITNSTAGEVNPEETGVPKFKRIQQRKEEWELRAQQALKKTLP